MELGIALHAPVQSHLLQRQREDEFRIVNQDFANLRLLDVHARNEGLEELPIAANENPNREAP